MRFKIILALVLCLSIGVAPAQLASPFSNSVWPAQTFTATGQTSTVLQLNGLTTSTSTVGSSFASGTLTLTGTSLTTVTFAVMGSSDNGSTFYALPIYTVSSPTASPTSTITATANGQYQFSLAGITHIKFVTSGTFTATNVSMVLTTSPNASIAKGGTSSGGGSPARVVYTSQIGGIAANANVQPGQTGTGVTDDSGLLNAALAGGNVDLEVNAQHGLSTALVLYSHTKVHCTPGNGFIMLPHSNNNTIVNAHQVAPTTVSSTGSGYLISNIVDTDISVDGCIINSNSLNAVDESTHRYQNNTSTGQALMGVQMLGITKFRLTNNLIYDTPTWGVLVSNASDVLIEDNRRQTPLPFIQLVSGQQKNDDGYDTIGPVDNVRLIHNYSQTGDDANCICSDGVQSASNSGDSIWYPHYHPIPFRNGPVTNVLEDGLFCDGSINCIDVLSATELIDRVQINNVNGTVNSIPFRISPTGIPGSGNVGSISVNNWNVQPTTAGGVFTLDDHFDLNSNISNLSFSNITEDNPVDGYPIFYQRSGTIKNLLIDGLKINNSTGNAAPYVLQTAAGTSNPVLNNISWTSNGNGYLLGGSVVPTTVTVSNYFGPNAVLAPSYAPAHENGDAFTNTYPTVATTYVDTTFNEASSGTALAGTTPATCTNGCAGPWTATAGPPATPIAYSTNSATLNSICTTGSGTYLACPVIINTGHSNYTMRYTFSSLDIQIAFILRWTNNQNYIEVAYSGGTWSIYDIVSNTATLEASSTFSAPAGTYTIVANGTSISMTGPGGSLSGTVSGSNTTDNVGFNDFTSGSIFTPNVITAMSVKSF